MSQPTVDDERTSDVTVEPDALPADSARTLRWSAYMIPLSGIGVIGNGIAMLYRAFYSAGFEAGVDSLGGITRADLASTNHELLHYITHLHVTVAGLLIALGMGMVALAWFGVRQGQRWAWVTVVSLPAVFLLHSLPIHETADFSFDALVHLGPGLVWLPALIVGAILALRGLKSVEDAGTNAHAG